MNSIGRVGYASCAAASPAAPSATTKPTPAMAPTAARRTLNVTIAISSSFGMTIPAEPVAPRGPPCNAVCARAVGLNVPGPRPAINYLASRAVVGSTSLCVAAPSASAVSFSRCTLPDGPFGSSATKAELLRRLVAAERGEAVGAELGLRARAARLQHDAGEDLLPVFAIGYADRRALPARPGARAAPRRSRAARCSRRP